MEEKILSGNNLPEPWVDLKITYKKIITFGPYNDQSRKEVVTKRGFYSNLFNYFCVPPTYAYFNKVLLPNGWGGDRILPNKIIKWEYYT